MGRYETQKNGLCGSVFIFQPINTTHFQYNFLFITKQGIPGRLTIIWKTANVLRIRSNKGKRINETKIC